MKGYKAFNKGLICDPTGNKPYQFKENTIFEETEAKVCRSGFHFCKSPLDVLDYYPLVNDDGEMSEFAEVEALDECHTDDNYKYSTKKIKIGAKIDFPQLVQASVNFELEKVPTGPKTKTTSKNTAKIGSSGDFAKIGSSGDFAKIGSSGNSAKINSTGKYAVVCCAGHGSIAKAKKGSWITLSEWEYNKTEKTYIPVCVKTEYVDGEKIKADTYYRLENGEFKELN